MTVTAAQLIGQGQQLRNWQPQGMNSLPDASARATFSLLTPVNILSLLRLPRDIDSPEPAVSVQHQAQELDTARLCVP